MISLVGSENHQTTYTYDNLLRVTQVVDRLVDDEYTTRYSYDVYGRIKNTIYPTNYSLVSYYNEYGYLSHYREGSSNNKVWEALEMNALGQLNRFATGNGLETTHTYYPGNARLHTVQTKAGSLNPIQDMEYGWDELGNLNYRKKWIDRNNDIYLNESFGYDVLNRLESIHLNEKETGWHRYDEAGLGNMIEKKADNNVVFANGAYEGSRPHALTSAYVNDNLRTYTSDDQDIGWASFDQPEYIDQGRKRLEFTYGHHHQRIRQLYRNENVETTKTFAGNCEFVSIDGQQYAYTYLSGPAGLFGIHVKNPDGTSGLFYIHTDHLGSLHTITNENGNLLQELSFDAWGNRRDPATWTMFDKNAETALFDRGFTGHEHLDGFQLINMNGRLYDPVVSRMLSPDNYVQSPDFSQSFNRYSYCFNNPMSFTDPTGEWAGWDDAIVGGIGFAFGYVSYGLTNGDWGWNAVGAGAIGAGTFLLGYYSGGATSAGSIANGFSAAGLQGSANTVALGYGANMVVANTVSSFMPSINIPFGDNVSLSISPAIMFGSTQKGLGVNASGTFQYEGFNATIGARFMSYGSNYGGGGNEGLEYWALGYDNGTTGLSYSSSYYNSGETSQQLGAVQFRHGDFSLTYQNDYMFGLPADGGDRYRTAAAQITYGQFSAGVNLFTGDPGFSGADRSTEIINGERTYKMNDYGDDPNKYRAGVAYVGYGNLRFGGNSERIRHIAQNRFAHDFIMGGKSPYFEVLNINRSNYFSVGTQHPYTLW